MAAPKEALSQKLAELSWPGGTRSVAEALIDISVDGEGHAQITLNLRGDEAQARQAVDSCVSEAALAVAGIRSVDVRFRLMASGRPVAEDDPVPGVKNVILVMSGKGGVGKSTVATNLALALSRLGTRVGLLDADIYGPSIPTMLGISGQPRSNGEKIIPLERFGIKLMSIGFLLEDARSAVVWRGPMLHGALLQFLRDVDWGKLDYLLLDLPPGTGDVALTLSQRVRSNGAVLVTTPQEVALQDVYKAVSMNQKVGIPILGVVENQSYFVCDGCQKRHELFGNGGGQKIAEQAQAPLLGKIPLDIAVRKWGDAGTPLVQASPASEIAGVFMQVAERLAEQIERCNSENQAPLSIDRSGGVNRRLPITR